MCTTMSITGDYLTIRDKTEKGYFHFSYFSNKINKNRCKLSVNSINRKQLKDIFRAGSAKRLLATGTCNTLLLGLKIKNQQIIFFRCKLYLFEQDKSFYTYINTIYVNKNHHCRSWHLHNACLRGLPLLSTNGGAVSTLRGLIVASIRLKQIYIKVDQVKIKWYTKTMP